MFVESVSVKNFRNLEEQVIALSDGINIFFGDNAQGKTNLLESLYICATGRSHRTHFDKELINFDNSEAHIKVCVRNGKENRRLDRIDVHLKRDAKKGIAINNIPIRKIGELFGVLHIVIFAPEDLQLIKAGPSERRRFIDLEMCQLSSVYYFNLRQYYKVLKQRNNLLKNAKSVKQIDESLFVWNSQLTEYGLKVIEQRRKFVDKISETASEIHGAITGRKEVLEIKYKPNSENDNFEKRLLKNVERDIFYGSTSCGPHKDDLIFLINGTDVRDYGSQGQQRTVSLAAKLAEIGIIREEKSTEPVLLLDDVLSELDEKRQTFLLESIKKIQTVITCTGIEDIVKKVKSHTVIYGVNAGKISEY